MEAKFQQIVSNDHTEITREVIKDHNNIQVYNVRVNERSSISQIGSKFQ